MLSATPHLSVAPAATPVPVQYLIVAPEQSNIGKQANFEITALDAAGHQVFNYNGTASLTDSGPGSAGATLPATLTFRHGEAEFQATFTAAGAATVTATETDTVNAIPILSSAATSVNAATLATQLVLHIPAHETPGRAVNVTVTAADASGNAAPTYLGNVTLSGAFTGGPLSYQFTANDAGKHTFQVTFPTTASGQQTVTAIDNAATPLTGAVSTNLTSPTTVTHFAANLPDNVPAGIPTYVTVEALNANNEEVSSYVGTVSFAANVGSTVTLPATYTFTTGRRWSSDNGEHAFQVTFGAIGAQGFSVTDTLNAALTATVPTNVFAAPVATHLLVVVPENSPTGVAVPVTVIALDAANHAVKNYANTLTLISTPNAGVTITGPITPSTANKGIQVFSVTFTTAGSTAVLTATDSGALAAAATTNVVTPPVRHGRFGWDFDFGFGFDLGGFGYH